MSSLEIIRQEAVNAIGDQDAVGSFLAGHNGPYFDEETPVRNTAHWLYTFCILFQRTGEDTYAKAAERAISYLQSPEARPMGAAFWIRKNPEKDFCNGLIGQAWVIESLLKAATVFDRPELYKLAEEVYLLHAFDEQLGVWNRLNVDGSHNSPDPTFNHQLWFAAAAGMLENTKEAVEASHQFFNRIAVRVKLYRDGVINHVSPVTRLSLKIKNPKKIIDGFVQFGYYHLSKRKLRKKASGYHAFNLYAFALLKDRFPDHPFWDSPKFQKMLKVTTKPSFLKAQDDNKYSYPYNPTGYEIAYVYKKFNFGTPDQIEEWIHRQEIGANTFIKNGGPHDPITLKARIYELSRILELEGKGDS
ncbi:MAG: hypothetical protein EA411_12540 [Saprospirales bacterium]|nr:MAG: hypothetical protein EA411_12540 [Saprospirales bacterium]